MFKYAVRFPQCVPQGSTLVPLLFILNGNVLLEVYTPSVGFQLYVEDAVIFLNATNTKQENGYQS